MYDAKYMRCVQPVSLHYNQSLAPPSCWTPLHSICTRFTKRPSSDPGRCSSLPSQPGRKLSVLETAPRRSIVASVCMFAATHLQRCFVLQCSFSFNCRLRSDELGNFGLGREPGAALFRKRGGVIPRPNGSPRAGDAAKVLVALAIVASPR